MIDFRYHLVSIASIFLALAVGIILGAGPLQGGIGRSLADEVTRLRDDRTALRDELAQARSAQDTMGTFIEESRPQILAGLLAGEKVTVVTLPDTSTEVYDALVSSVQQAGGEVVTHATVGAGWASSDPGRVADRVGIVQRFAATTTGNDQSVLGQLVAELLCQVPRPDPLDAAPTPSASSTSAATPSTPAATTAPAAGTATPTATASATATATPTTTATPEPALDQEALRTALADKDLLTVDGDLVPASLAVIVAPASLSDSADAALYAGLASSLDLASSGAVVTAPVADDATICPVIVSIRDSSSLRRSVSTVDNAQLAYGQISVVVALHDQAAGKTVQLGSGNGATAPFATPSS